jgi:hypothetical protein
MRIFASFASLLVVIACAACTVEVQGNGVPAQEGRIVSPFHDLSISDTLHAQIVVGPTASVVVHGDENLVHHIRTDVEGGYLFIDSDVSYSTSMELGVLITTPALYGVVARDVSTVEVDGLYAATFSVVAEDASSVRLSGYADDVDLWIDGASDVDAAALGTFTTWLEAYGSSTAQVNVTDRLSGTVADASTAYVYGRPTLIDAVVLDAAQIVIE